MNSAISLAMVSVHMHLAHAAIVSHARTQVARALDVDELQINVERLEQSVMVEMQDAIDSILEQGKRASELLEKMRIELGNGDSESSGASSSNAHSSSPNSEESDEA